MILRGLVLTILLARGASASPDDVKKPLTSFNVGLGISMTAASAARGGGLFGDASSGYRFASDWVVGLEATHLMGGQPSIRKDDATAVSLRGEWRSASRALARIGAGWFKV